LPDIGPNDFALALGLKSRGSGICRPGPAQPVIASRPPSGANWVHEIKHDGYRMIVRRDGPMVWIYSRNANDWTTRLPAIASAAERLRAKSFTIDGEAVVVGPDGLSRFEELRRREAAHTAILYAFDLIEHDGEDLRDRPFLDRKAALARLLHDTEAGIVLNEHVAGGLSTLAGLVPRASCPRRSTVPIDPVRARRHAVRDETQLFLASFPGGRSHLFYGGTDTEIFKLFACLQRCCKP
jgi:bifunctional non-homologous end joining protein LigD